ncbi:MAG: hypothetical protein U5K81_02370 [Trueperaceae bacterium]|nr:hypothetical protein [Trueperaceae bacterium]
MKLARLRIDRLPGIETPFQLDGLSGGINVLVGPNASGKSSVVRAVVALLDPSAYRARGVTVEADFEDDEGTLQAHRIGDEVAWHRAGVRIAAPPLPEPHLLPCYTLRIEDLTALGDTDARIAEALAREASGGYDLNAAREAAGFTLKARHGQAERQALAHAEDEVRAAQRAHEALAADQARLADLRSRLQACRREAARAPAYQAARELHAAEARMRELEVALEAFPPGMELLHGDLLRQLDTAHNAHDQATRALAAAERDQAEAQRRTHHTGLDPHQPSDADLEPWRAAVAHLRTQEGTYAAQAREEAAQRIRLRAAREDLGAPAPEAAARLGPDTVRAAETELEAKRALDAERAALEAALDALPAPAAEAPDPVVLDEGRRHLAAWLRAHQPSWPLRRRIGLVTVIAAVAVAAWAATAVHPAYALTALAAAVGLAALSPARPHARRRARTREAYRDTGLPAPADWTADAVHQQLDRLEREIAEARTRALDDERRATLERQRARTRERLDAEAKRLQARAETLGFDPRHLDGSLQRWLRLVDERDRTHRAAAAAGAERVRLETALARGRQDVLGFLARYRAAPEAMSPDSVMLERALEALAERVRARDAAAAEAARAFDRIDAARARLEEARAQRRSVFEHAGLLGDSDAEQALADADARALEHELRARMDLLDAYRERVDERARVRAGAEAAERRLNEHPEILEAARTATGGTLGALHTESEQAQHRADALTKEIAAIEAEVDHAATARRLEAANAARQAAEDRLRDRLEEATWATAGAFLLDQVEAAHRSEHRPATLRRAADAFARFTHHRYRLAFQPGDEGPAFRAYETATGRWRAPSELSTGTLAQLLLAVRISFATEAERGREPLPLFLDEALTTADPERFHAVADALRQVARQQGRQVFYLTARADDAAFWRSAGGSDEDASPDETPHVIDLGRLRADQHAIIDPGTLALPPRERPPHPGGDTPEAYATRIAVPAADPWQDAGAVHVFHLLRDDLALTWRLLCLGVERAGQLEGLLASPAAEHLLPGDTTPLLTARVAAARAWLQAWREGRGRPVDRAALERSGAVSETFLDRVDALAQELNGDAADLLDALEEGRVSGFRSDKREELASFLQQEGFVDPRPPWTRTPGRGACTRSWSSSSGTTSTVGTRRTRWRRRSPPRSGSARLAPWHGPFGPGSLVSMAGVAGSGGARWRARRRLRCC